MLKRAASSAYSWWWASHVRTKQSKWLDNNLHDMDDRVKKMLKVIDQDADSFGKRAEIYFQKRPELITYVEETYRAYRALAERYDHISGELHKANHTIATAFPDEVQYAMLEEEEEEADNNFQKALNPIGAGKMNKPAAVEAMIDKTREEYLSELEKNGTTSEITKENAQEEINKLQKGILALQTEKEFIKSSYENLVAKYWDIEKQMTAMQEVVFYLEEKYDATVVIEDDEARSLMTATALKSCEDAIGKLEEQRIKSMGQAKIESDRIKSVAEKLKVLKGDDDQEVAELSNYDTEMMSFAEEAKEQVYSLNKERLELQSVSDKVKQHFPGTSGEEIAEKIDELVNKVIALELTVSSKSTQMNRLNSENNHLENYLHALEEEKTVLINDSNKLTEKLKEAEEELRKVQTIEKTVQDEELNFQKNIIDFSRSLSGISEKLQSPKNQELASILDSMVGEDDSNLAIAFQRESEDIEVTKDHYTNEDLGEGIHVSNEVRDGIEDNSESAANSHPQVNLTKLQEVEEENEFKEKGSFLADIGNNVGNDQETPFVKDHLVEELHGLDRSEYPAADSHIHVNSAAIYDPKEENEIKDKDSLYAGIGFDKEKLFDDFHVNQNGQEDNSESKTDRQLRNKSTNFENLQEVGNETKNKDTFHDGGGVILENEKESTFDKEEILKLHQLLLNSLEGRERILLSQYASLLRNYKEAMKRLSQEEKSKEDHLHETTALIRELTISNTMKDEEIRFLRQVLESSKINLLYNPFVEANDILPQYPEMSRLSNPAPTDSNKSNYGSDVVSFLGGGIDEQVKNDWKSISPMEQKIKKDIDAVLDENLNFWLRFSASLHRVLEFQTTYEDIGPDLVKLHGSGQITEPESAKIAARLRTLKSELHVWLEQSSILRGELESRFSSICSIQKEISEAMRAKSEEELVRLTPYQAAKLQGEVLNMQQENNKVASELQVGQNHARELQAEVEKELARLEENFETYTPKSSSHESFSQSSSPRRRVPLSVFLFGTKPKKPSIFARINPAFHKQYNQHKSKAIKH